jgi:hypothetical protein
MEKIMKWMAEWHGIQLIAETDNDVKILKRLKSRLPSGTATIYDIGKVEVTKKLFDNYGDNQKIKAKYILEFSR